MDIKKININKSTIFVSKEANKVFDENMVELTQGTEEYRRISINGKKYYVHVLVQETFSGRKRKSGEVVDHINNNKWDNRFSNLRFSSKAENNQNTSKTKNNSSSIYKGVHFVSSRNKWSARIVIDGKRKFLGYFRFEEDAAKRYNEEASSLWGDRANLNQIKFGVFRTKTRKSKIEIKKIENEIFTKITLNEKDIEVSNMGRIRYFHESHKRTKTTIGFKKGSGYRRIHVGKGDLRKSYSVHRLVAHVYHDFDLNSEKVIDHISGDREDNRAINLRVLNHSQNAHNQLKRKGTTSKYLGVYFLKSRNKKPWRAMIQENGKKKHIGYFEREIDASNAYKQRQKLMLGTI